MIFKRIYSFNLALEAEILLFSTVSRRETGVRRKSLSLCPIVA